MKVVKLLESVTLGTLYSAGETAGFSNKVAENLVAKKLAEFVKPKEAAKEVKTGSGQGEGQNPPPAQNSAQNGNK